MSTETLNREIARGNNRVFRRLLIKRRLATTGLFEDEWQDITSDVKKWGSATFDIDSIRRNYYNFSQMRIVVANDNGRYNPHTDENSFWYGYADRQRSLVRIEAGFLRQVKGEDGIWANIENPTNVYWDRAGWDNNDWDASGALYTGIISGDILQSDDNQITLPIRPILDVLRSYAARNLSGYGPNLTASGFIEMVRDHTDVNGAYLFRPFFGNTTTNWEITATTNVYSDLNTSTAEEVISANVWDIAVKLAEAENFILHVSPSGSLKFLPRDANTTTAVFEFHGKGSYSSEYGHTIKRIKRYGQMLSKFYSRVEVKWTDSDTETSYEVIEATMTVAPDNPAWLYGERTFSYENLWIPNSTIAETIATTIFNDVSALKNEIEFEASFIPRLSILDRIKVSYDTSGVTNDSLWDANNWADDVINSSLDLIFDSNVGDALRLDQEEFNVLKLQFDLDKFTTTIVARET